MTAIPSRQNKIEVLIDKGFEQTLQMPRPHFGVSMIGHHCDRYLWLNFRWAIKEKFSGRMLRLFMRGQNEEEIFIQLLTDIGVEVVSEDKDGNQFRVDFGNHISGSMDGVILEGVPEAPSKLHVLELKTHNDKSFKELKAKGVQQAKPMHYAQMQVYMLGANIDRALYLAVNKNDDELYSERVRFDKDYAEKLVARAHRIVSSDMMPEPCAGASPDWYQCKFCPAYDFCHVTKWATQVNCRTCAHSTAQNDGTWSCARWEQTIPDYHRQTVGCESHVFHPDLVPWQFVEGDGISAKYRDGNREFWNGERGLSSIELVRQDMES